MKQVRGLPKGNTGLAVKLLLAAVVTSQLMACGGGGSTKTAASGDQQISATSNDEKIPTAYRAPTSVDSLPEADEVVTKQQVQQTGNIKLSWSAPSTRTDGQPLSLAEIDGYRVYYGAKKGDYVKGADVKDGAAEAVTVTNVPVGKYYVVMTTYDVNGVESGYSQSIKKNVL